MPINNELWEKARKKAEEELKGLGIIPCDNWKGCRGSAQVVYVEIPLINNKLLIQTLVRNGWSKWRGSNVDGKRIIVFAKVYKYQVL